MLCSFKMHYTILGMILGMILVNWNAAASIVYWGFNSYRCVPLFICRCGKLQNSSKL